jgi:nucleoside-diphosphate-sugar epimerase
MPESRSPGSASGGSGFGSGVKRALVAGGAGFIGSHLCDLLLARGYQVTAIDNLVTGRRANLAAALSRGLKLVEQDINEPLPTGADWTFDEIYNLASPASPVDFAKMPVFIMDTSARGHRNLLELARATKARVLFASTSEVYGDPEVHPQREDYFGNVNPIGPRSCYDEAKRFGEALSFAFHRQYGVETRIARIFNTYGTRMRPNDGRIIPNFFIQALQGQAVSIYGEGTQTRSFCFVSDLVDGLYRLMQSPERMPVNIGNPLERTVLEIASAVNALTGNRAELRRLPLPENDPKQRKPDIARAGSILGWKPQISLEDGLKQCMDYFKEELRLVPGGIHAPTIG